MNRNYLIINLIYKNYWPKAQRTNLIITLKNNLNNYDPKCYDNNKTLYLAMNLLTYFKKLSLNDYFSKLNISKFLFIYIIQACRT